MLSERKVKIFFLLSILSDCKRLVLTSRSGVKTGYHARCVRRWESLGVIVNVSKIDISESQNCLHLLGQCQKMGPIGGIFNLAMVSEIFISYIMAFVVEQERRLFLFYWKQFSFNSWSESVV